MKKTPTGAEISSQVAEFIETIDKQAATKLGSLSLNNVGEPHHVNIIDSDHMPLESSQPPAIPSTATESGFGISTNHVKILR